MEEYWNSITTFCQGIWQDGKGDFLGWLMAIILTAIFLFFRKYLTTAFSSILRFRDRQVFIPLALRSYQDSLTKETLSINHSWKIEGQSLKELIVPVHISEKNKKTRLSLAEYIKSQFSENNHPVRLALIGEAGSGKSVAMGLVAREVWNIQRPQVILPVLLTFSDIKQVKSEDALEKVIVKNLEKHQFEQGKRSHRAEDYVKEHLYDGNMLLLLDGFDELDKSTRFEITRFLKDFFKRHPAIHFVVSSRTSVWRQNPNIFSPIKPTVIHMAEFTPLEIRMFVSQWGFKGNKSGEQLAGLIAEKVYLKTIAVNPLMLTIISFLYAQPKRILPDNRVKFYKECIEALLEKWDNAKSLDRANEFETIDKVTILSRIAYQHISNDQTTDEEINKAEVLHIIGDTMKALSRPVEKREKMLNEIVQNAELLIELPPEGFKFPHRTFMEYFAAVYFYEQNKGDVLLDLYEKDKGRWQETVALYCGLNTDLHISDLFLKKFLVDFIDSEEAADTDTFVFRALVESARINEQIASDILQEGQQYLEKEINKDIVENLGYIAVNPNWQHAKKAKEILLNQLNKKLSTEHLQQVIIALVNVKDEDIRKTLLKHAEEIDLIEFMKNLGQDAKRYAITLIENMGEEKIAEICAGLREGGALEFLVQLMLKSNKKEIRENAAFELAMASASPEFFQFVNDVDFSEGQPEEVNYAKNKFKSDGWNKERVETENGQKVVYFICGLAARYIIRKDFKINTEEMNPWIKLIVSGVFMERGFSFFERNLFGFPLNATLKGIKLYQNISKMNLSNDLARWPIIIYIITYFSLNFIAIFESDFKYFHVITIIASICVMLFLNFETNKGINLNKKLRYYTFLLIIIIMAPIFLTTPLFYRAVSKSSIIFKRNYLIIVFGFILGGIFTLLPISFNLKVINIGLIIFFTLFIFLGSYLNICGVIVNNEDVSKILRSK